MRSHYKVSVISRLISGLLLIIAIGQHPYSYFILLRWLVSVTSFYTGWMYSQLGNHSWAWFFFIAGVLFNPIFPIYLDRSTWQVIDIILAIVFLISLKISKNKSE